MALYRKFNYQITFILTLNLNVMKKSLVLMAAMAGVLFAACEPEGGQSTKEPQASDITTILPDDLEVIELDYANQSTELDFEWESADDEATYSIVFSLADDLSSPFKVEAGKVFEYALTHEDLDEMIFNTTNVIDTGRLAGTALEDQDAMAESVAKILRNLFKEKNAFDKVEIGEIKGSTLLIDYTVYPN